MRVRLAFDDRPGDGGRSRGGDRPVDGDRSAVGDRPAYDGRSDERGSGHVDPVERAGHVGDDQHVDAARSLHRWLVSDPELRGAAEVATASARPQQGQMGGGALDVVDVVLGNALALSSLVVSVAAWRGARPRPMRVRIERGDAAVTVEGDSPEAVERVLRALESDGSGGGPAAGAGGSGGAARGGGTGDGDPARGSGRGDGGDPARGGTRSRSGTPASGSGDPARGGNRRGSGDPARGSGAGAE